MSSLFKIQNPLLSRLLVFFEVLSDPRKMEAGGIEDIL
jgi:hypothetical protein